MLHQLDPYGSTIRQLEPIKPRPWEGKPLLLQMHRWFGRTVDDAMPTGGPLDAPDWIPTGGMESGFWRPWLTCVHRENYRPTPHARP